jgi:hypothetical protein
MMKKIFLFSVVVVMAGCAKETLNPDPAPEPVVVVENVDTSRHNLLNDWTCYQYKYTNKTEMWIMETNWFVQLTANEIRIDEGRDGIFEKIYPVNIINPKFLTITYPTTTKGYEVRETMVGKKRGYDLVCADKGLDPDVYSLVK